MLKRSKESDNSPEAVLCPDSVSSLRQGMKVSVVIPARNEEGNIGEVVNRLKQLGYFDILVIDGKSTDRTAAVARACGARVVLQNGNGKGDAVRQVFNNADGDSDVIVLMDADGSMSPDEVPRFVQNLARFDVVKGSRFLRGGYTYDMTFLRRLGNLIILSLINFIWSTHYTDICYGFAAFRRESMKKLAPILSTSDFEIETEMFIKSRKMSLKTKEIPSVELRRRSGKSSLSAFRDGLPILNTVFRELFSNEM